MLTNRPSPSLAMAPLPQVSLCAESISENALQEWVDGLAVPRHYELEQESNRKTALWIGAQLQSRGYHVELQGQWWNVVALPKQPSGPLVLVCAPYDSIGGCAGADDNASAVSAMLGCARACASL